MGCFLALLEFLVGSDVLEYEEEDCKLSIDELDDVVLKDEASVGDTGVGKPVAGGTNETGYSISSEV